MTVRLKPSTGTGKYSRSQNGRNPVSGFNDGRLAQLGEHLLYTQGVGGSNPSPPICREAFCRAILGSWTLCVVCCTLWAWNRCGNGGLQTVFPDLPTNDPWAKGRTAKDHWPPSYLDANSTYVESLRGRLHACRLDRLEYTEAVVRAEAFIADPVCQNAVRAVAQALSTSRC